jgi:photosystem II CP47 chlorophyll apoprotein
LVGLVQWLLRASNFDPSDPVLNPMWRQGMFVLPFDSFRVSQSWVVGQLAVNLLQTQEFGVMKVLQRTLIIRSLFAASIWHWVMWDLELFRDPRKKTQH